MFGLVAALRAWLPKDVLTDVIESHGAPTGKTHNWEHGAPRSEDETIPPQYAQFKNLRTSQRLAPRSRLPRPRRRGRRRALLAAIVGTGVMAENLAVGNDAVALVRITIFGPIR